MSNCFGECTGHQYADDTQIQFPFFPSDAREALRRLDKCLKSVFKYSHGLKLNQNKSAIIYFGPA